MNKYSILYLQIFLLFLLSQAVRAEQSNEKIILEDIEVHNLENKALNRSYKIFVRLPMEYNKPENKNKSYPVVYMNDGENAFSLINDIHANLGRY